MDYNDDNSSKNEGSENKKNNKQGIFSIQSSLNLKSYENTIFNYFFSLNEYTVFPKYVEILFVIIESLQLFTIIYNEYFITNLPKLILLISNIANLRIITNTNVILTIIECIVGLAYIAFILNFILNINSIWKSPPLLLKINSIFFTLMQRLCFFPILFRLLGFLDCTNSGDTICFKGNHATNLYISIGLLFLYFSFSYIITYSFQTYIPLSNVYNSISTNKTIISFRRIAFIEVLNIFLIRCLLNNKLISSLILFIGFVYLLYVHYNYQCYHNNKVNCLYSSLWFSMTLSSIPVIITSIFNIELSSIIFIVISLLGLILGWFLNNIYSNWYNSRIASKIERKYNQQHVISRLKEEIEMDRYDDEDNKSIETIVTTKKVSKKEKVFKKPIDCAYFSKFIMHNRSIGSFNLMNCIFKEGVSQFERLPEMYIIYFNYLHGVRRFISINHLCFIGDDANDLIKNLKHISEKVLYKSSQLSKTFFMKFLVYHSVLSYDLDRSLLANDDNSSNQGSNNFELMNLRNQSIQHHLAALNTLKNLMLSMKSLDNISNINYTMSLNDELTQILDRGEKIYKKFVMESDYSKESLELYVLFLRNSMNREDLADAYIQRLEENENIHVDKNDKKEKYERSEKSSSFDSEGRSKKAKIMKNNALKRFQRPLHKLLSVMQIVSTIAILIGVFGIIAHNYSYNNVISNMDVLVYGVQSPLVMCKIKCGLRFIGLTAAAGIPQENITNYDPGVKVNVDYLEQEYLAAMYPYHSIDRTGFYSIHPLAANVVSETRDKNYFEIMSKIYRYSKMIYAKLLPQYMNPTFFYDRYMRFFIENAKGQFGKLFLNSLLLTEKYIQGIIGSHVNMVYIVSGVAAVLIIALILFVILPNADKSNKFTIDIIRLFRSLPSSYYNEQSNDYGDQVNEICENYDIENEVKAKSDKKIKFSSIKLAKYSYVTYSLITLLFLLYPFATVFLYKTECLNLTNFLVNSSRRSYYLFSINLFNIEVYIRDRFYYQEGEEERILTERYKELDNLEKELKSGKYGGKPSSEYEIYQGLYNNKGCVRHPFSMWKCDLRVFDEYYTEELANSPIDFMMVEYLSNLADYLNDLPQKKYNLEDQNEVRELLYDLLDNPHVQLIKKLSEDILGFIDQMDDIGINYLVNKITKFKKAMLICHLSSSVIVFILFYFFVTKPIKKQLRAIDSLINIIYSIPHSVYNTSPVLKGFIEKGELESK